MMSGSHDSISDTQVKLALWPRVSTLLAAVVVVVVGGGLGFLLALVVSFFVYLGSYNMGHVIRLETFGVVVGACLAFLAITEVVEERVPIRPRVRVAFGVLGVVAVLCSEWYFFGIGLHQTAVQTVYGAGGQIQRNWSGQVTSVELMGRPYSGFAGDDFALLAEFPQMTRLRMWWPLVGVVEAEHISHCTQLESLTIFGRPKDDPTLGRRPDDRAIGRLRPLVRLEELKLAWTGITDEGLLALNAFTELRTLTLDSTEVSDTGVMSLHLPRLVNLDLSETQVGDAGVAHIAAMATYDELRLCSPQITHAGIEALGNQSQLRIVVLAFTQVSGPGFESVKNWTRLESLNLNETNVTDEDLRWVATLSHLQDIQLSGTAITDAGVRHCEGLSNLTYLLLNGTSVSREGVARLQSKLPSCNVAKTD
jgi:hypothetical protein